MCVFRVNVNTTDATAGATALLLPAQNTHTLHDPKRDTEHARAGGVEDGLGVGGLDGGGDVGNVVREEADGSRMSCGYSTIGHTEQDFGTYFLPEPQRYRSRLPRAPSFRRLPSSRRGEALWERVEAGSVCWGRPLLSRPRGAVGSAGLRLLC